MAEEAQELVVTNESQPLYVELELAVTDEIAEGLLAITPASQTIDIDPAVD